MSPGWLSCPAAALLPCAAAGTSKPGGGIFLAMTGPKPGGGPRDFLGRCDCTKGAAGAADPGPGAAAADADESNTGVGGAAGFAELPEAMLAAASAAASFASAAGVTTGEATAADELPCNLAAAAGASAALVVFPLSAAALTALPLASPAPVAFVLDAAAAAPGAASAEDRCWSDSVAGLLVLAEAFTSRASFGSVSGDACSASLAAAVAALASGGGGGTSVLPLAHVR